MLDRPPSATCLNHPLARFRSHVADARTSNDLIRLALPILAEQFVLLSVSMIDTYLVGHLGVVPMGAGGLANQFVVFANMLFTAIGVASVAVVARATGARDEGAANRSLGQAIVLALLACQLLAPVLLLAMGASSEIVVAGDAIPPSGEPEVPVRLSDGGGQREPARFGQHRDPDAYQPGL